MVYDLEYQKKIASQLDEVQAIHHSLAHEVVSLQSNLSNEKAMEYLMQGALRRPGTLARFNGISMRYYVFSGSNSQKSNYSNPIELLNILTVYDSMKKDKL